MGVSGGCAAASVDDGMKLELFRFVVQVVPGRWFMLFSSFLTMAAAGATNIFSIYSKDIKTSLGYNQSTLNTLSFKDLAANVGILCSLINEVTSSWVILSLGAAMNLFSYLAITGRTAPPCVWLMCLYICVGANSHTFANMSNQVQVPSAADADGGASTILCRPPAHRLRSPQFPLLRLRRHRLLLRRAMVVALRHHLRDPEQKKQAAPAPTPDSNTAAMFTFVSSSIIRHSSPSSSPASTTLGVLGSTAPS